MLQHTHQPGSKTKVSLDQLKHVSVSMKEHVGVCVCVCVCVCLCVCERGRAGARACACECLLEPVFPSLQGPLLPPELRTHKMAEIKKGKKRKHVAIHWPTPEAQ